MMKLSQLFGQFSVYALFALGIGYFSTEPTYIDTDPAKALIKVSFAHVGQPVTACRKRTKKELSELAANMRKASVCPRQRVPLRFELVLDGEVMLNESLAPTGWRGDGPSKFYRKFEVSAGQHVVMVKLRDSRRSEGFDYISQRVITLAAGNVISIDFKPAQGGFIYE